MKNLVSVIVPVYNSSTYVEECLNSIINQTYNNIEIIVINDGSTDNSEEIIKEIQKNSSKIIYMKQANKGAGETRNTGIGEAKGDYIVFIDSDDKIKEDYIETLVNKIENENLDVVYSGVMQFNNEQLFKSLYQYTILAPMAKIYRKSYLLKHKIVFSKQKLAEDAYFNLQVLLNTKNIEVIDYCGYFYRRNEESITHRIKKKKISIDIEKILNEMYIKWNEKRLANEFQKDYIELYFFMYVGFGYLKELCKNLSFQDFAIEYDKVINFFKKNNIFFGKNKLLGYKEIFKADFEKKIILKLFLIIDKVRLGKICLWLYNKLIQ